MEELLFNKDWTSFDVEERLDSPWIRINRDEEGWMKPSSLPFAEEDSIYRAIRGAEINKKTGAIHFFLDPWSAVYPPHEQLFTLTDLQEMVEKNISSAVFSLDAVDSEKQYHPFNLMRFAPSQLFESEMLNTVLLTDYLLKFITTYQEVQGYFPFEQRPIDALLQHVPAHLRQIIDDYYHSNQRGLIHRFWIEAEEMDVSISGEATEQNMLRIALKDLRMVVKKHRMERDIHGELQDVGNEDEGWPIYVLTAEQMNQLELGQRIIEGHAMIFVIDGSKLYYWDNHALLRDHTPPVDERLTSLLRLPKDSQGKILKAAANNELIYQVTLAMAKQSGESHHYSPEYLFAQEFSIHYDEFAKYLPVFARLKELCRISALIRVLDNIRQSNKEEIEAIDYLLVDSSSSTATPPSTKGYERCKESYELVCQEIRTGFEKQRAQLSSSNLHRKWHEELTRIRREISPLQFDTCSPEVKDACQKWHDQIAKDNPKISSFRIWSEVINPKKSEIAKEMTQARKKSCRSQMLDLFSTRIPSSYELGKLVDSFIEGNVIPLENALIKQEQKKAKEDIHKQFPQSSYQDIASALDDNGSAAASRIASAEAKSQLREQKDLKKIKETGFSGIQLGKQDSPVDLKDTCLWVPASVRHEVKKDDSGHMRYSFFVYGGVSAQPRINIVQGGNGPLSGNPVGRAAFSNVNAQAAMNMKLAAVEKAQKTAVQTKTFSDGRIRYYGAEIPSNTTGPTRGRSFVTEHNTKTGQVRSWMECYDQSGKVNRVHPKMMDGQTLKAQHYPPTKTEIEKQRRP